MRTYDVVMTPSDDGHWVLKSEADREIRRYKYKRCLAMAKWCAAECDIYNLTPKFAKVEFYRKWRKRWLKLAEGK